MITVTEQLVTTAVAELIAIGERGIPAVPQSLQDRDLSWSVMGNHQWDNIAWTYPERTLQLLIKGLVLYSQARDYSIGGKRFAVVDSQ